MKFRPYRTTLDNVDSLLLTLLGLSYRKLRNLFRHKKPVQTKYASALLSYYTFGTRLEPLAEGTIADMHYTVFLTPEDMVFIYRVELPFASKIHLLGVPKHSNIKQIDPTGRHSVFEEVMLEGDYINYFNLYCARNQQVDARYMLDPKAMAFTVDFCRSHSWEIIGSELYFVQTGAYHPSDATHVFDDVEGFVNTIRPAIERPLSPAELKAITPLYPR